MELSKSPGKGEGEERGKTWSRSDRKLRLFAGQSTRGGRINSEPETQNHCVYFCNFYFLIIYSELSFECFRRHVIVENAAGGASEFVFFFLKLGTEE